jgi:hypothetical protein
MNELMGRATATQQLAMPSAGAQAQRGESASSSGTASSPTLLDMATQLQAIAETLEQIGTLAVADEQKVLALAQALAHVKESGALSGEDMQAFKNAGIDMAKMMAEQWEAFGFGQKKTVAQIKKMAKDSAIGMVHVARALQMAAEASGRYYNEAAGNLLALQESWDQLQAEIHGTLVPMAVTIIQELADLMQWLVENDMAERLQPHIDELCNSLKQLTSSVDTNSVNLDALSRAIVALTALIPQINPAAGSEEKEPYYMELLKSFGSGAIEELGGKAMEKLLKWIGTRTAIAGAEAVGTRVAGIALAETVTVGAEMMGAAAAAETAGLALIGAASGIGLLVAAAGAVGYAAYKIYNKPPQDEATKRAEEMQRTSLYSNHYSPRPNAPGVSIGQVPKMELPVGPDPEKMWGKRNPNPPQFNLADLKPQQEAVHKISQASDNIISGGRRQTIINVNAPMYKVERQVFENIKDSIADWEPKLKEALLRILQSANAAQ